MHFRVIVAAPFLVFCAITIVSGVSRIDAQQAVRVISSPASGNSAEPQLTVSSRGVLLSWLERTGARATLKFAERTRSGWSQAREVASGDDWFVNWADVPSVIRLADGTLAAHWLQKSGPGTSAYDVRLAYSRDDGRSWSAPFLPHHDTAKAEHGFASLFQLPGAGLGLVWLDGRAMGGDSHGGASHGAMTLRFGAIDRNWKQTEETAIDLRVCDCCPTAAAVTADGPLVAFRNRTEDEIRDIYVSRLEKGKWSEPTPVHGDGWRIAACPVNGPALSARGRTVALAWFVGMESPGHAFVAFSSDAGRTFGAPVRVDDAATIGRVDVELMSDGSAIASWIESTNGRTEFRFRRVDRSGATSPAQTVATVANSRETGFPRLAAAGDELIFAWTDVARAQPSAAATSRVLTASAMLPLH